MTISRFESIGEVPSPRSGHSAAIDEKSGIAYLYGGLGQKRYGDLYQCDITNGKAEWKNINIVGESEPEPRSKSSFVLYNDTLILFGGWGTGHRNSEASKKNDMWEIRIGEWKWRQIKPKTNPPPARSSHNCTVTGKTMWLFGGIGAQKYNDTWRYEIPTNSWYRVPGSNKIGTRSSFGELLVDKDSLYVFGGLGCGQFNDLWKRTSESDWTLVPTEGEIPIKRGRHTTSIINNTLYVIGGTNLRNSMSGIHMLNLTTLTWSYVDTPRAFRKRDSMASVVYQDKIYLFGGCDSCNVWFRDVWEICEPSKGTSFSSDAIDDDLPHTETFTSEGDVDVMLDEIDES